MDITNRIKNALAGFRKVENSGPDPNAFLRYGNQKRMPSTWSTPEITDQDFYTGYGFAIINKRANRAVTLGKNFVYTDAKEEIVKKANEEKVNVTHPYLDLIKNSVEFAQRDFWYDISTYLDLEGIYYLMAVRTVTQGGRVGNVQKFTLLNPYNVRQVVNTKGELAGYVERYNNLQREIPKEMVIPIRLLNPFDQGKTYSLADAARDSQFTMKQANDFAREAIDGNLNAPGILSSAIELPDDQFDNFVSRVKNHGRGEPLFGNGAGTVSWVDMQTDLDKAALDKINSINRDVLLAVAGTSKTGVGVEESGTGREVSRTQKDDFTENAVMPQIENIIDALNLDYRRFYESDYKRFGYNLALSNPLETNKDAEQADVDIRDSQFALTQSLVDKGYSYEISAKYAKGLIDITDIGEPTEVIEVTPVDPPADTPTDPPADAPVDPPADPANSVPKETEIYEGYPIPLYQYLGEHADQIESQTENTSVLHLVEDTDKTRITHIEARENSLIGVIDEDSYIKLGEFKEEADREEILAKLNKRYTNQLVAVKHKGIRRNLNKDFYDKLPNGVSVVLDHLIDKYQDKEWFEQAFSQYREHVVNSSVEDLRMPGVTFAEFVQEISSDRISQLITVKEPEHTHKIDNAVFDKQEQIDSSTNGLLNSVFNAENQLLNEYLNKITEGQLAPGADLEAYINNLALPFAVWFTVMLPIFASYRVQETASDLNVDAPIFAMNEDIKASITDFSQREARSHLETIKSDIQNALTIIKTQTSDPEVIKQMLQAAFIDIQKRRAPLVASNASNRIFALSQYEADLQVLSRNNLLGTAFKQLFSSTGTPCRICSYLITQTNESPIPFTSDFASKGESITAEGLTMNFNYENIIAGNVHPNCRCYYKIIIIGDDGEEITQQQALESQAKAVTESVMNELAPIINKMYADKTASDETMKKLDSLAEKLDVKIESVESQLEQIDKRTKEARQLKEELVEANELKSKLSEAEEYARQLESILDGQS